MSWRSLNIVSQPPLPPTPATLPAAASDARGAAAQAQAPVVPVADASADAAQAAAAAESALTKAVSAALSAIAASRNNSLASLMADLVQAQDVPSIPAPVLAAVTQVLALRTPIDTALTAEDIKTAVTNSGLFTESNPATDPRAPAPAAPSSENDIKNAVLTLQQTLKSWLGGTSAPVADNAARFSQPPANSLSLSTYTGNSGGNSKPLLPAPATMTSSALPQAASVSATMAPSAAPPAEPKFVLALATAQPQVQITAASESLMNLAVELVAEPVPEIVSTAVAASGQTMPGQTEPVPASNPIQPSILAQPSVLAQPSILKNAAQPPPSAAPLAAPESLQPTTQAPPALSASAPIAAGNPPFVASSAPTASLEALNPAPVANPVSTPPQALSESSPETMIEASPDASGAPPPAASATGAQAAPPTSAQPPAPGADIKSALLMLQEEMKTSLPGATAQPYSRPNTMTASPESSRFAPNGAALPSNREGATGGAQRVSSPVLSADSIPRAIGEILAKRADAALSHMKLLQIASLPDTPQTAASPSNANSNPRWIFEIPFATPQGSMVAQFQIDRDAGGGPGEPTGPVWRARFSLDVEPIGPVHAQVALVGERAWVTLWAERADGVQTLREKEALLSQSLKDTDLVAEIAFCLGAPRRRVAAAGQFVDSAS